MSKIKVEVCCGLQCSMKGGQELYDLVESDELLINNKIDIIPVNCLQCCQDGFLSPVVSINGECYTKMTVERLISTLRTML